MRKARELITATRASPSLVYFFMSPPGSPRALCDREVMMISPVPVMDDEDRATLTSLCIPVKHCLIHYFSVGTQDFSCYI